MISPGQGEVAMKSTVHRCNKNIRAFLLFGLSLLFASAALAQSDPVLVDDNDLVVTLLATNLGDFVSTESGPRSPQGEFSFAAWVEVGGKAFLFDTGWTPRNVLENAEMLGIDLSRAEDVVISHHHYDHVGGIETLRSELSKQNPNAISRVHVAEGMFASRPEPDGREDNLMIGIRQRMEADGVEFIVYDEPSEIAPGVWLSGPIPRVHDERNFPVGPEWMIRQRDAVLPDTVPESQVMVIQTKNGPVVITGCAHAGLINSLEYAGKFSNKTPQAALGGFHLYGASDEVMSWTANHIKEMHLEHLLSAHCTGVEKAFTLRQLSGMDQAHSRVGSVGTKFDGEKGIIPGFSNN
jgi:7,8-dihydropterin-6-yl-methyl-4-(beta-D-ribofuranosyl)aminobenzene 5'-phosphate synthase